MKNFACICAALSLLSACGGEEEPFTEGYQTLGAPRALGKNLVFVMPERNEAASLSLDGGPDRAPYWTEITRGASLAVDRKGDHKELLMLCRGRRGDRNEASEPAELIALAADGKLRRFELGNPFDHIEQSDDGRHAILFKTQTTERTLDNPNEIAVVDLDAKGDEGVHLRTLRSFGDSPTRAFFSPDMRIGEEERRLAVIFTESDVQLLDLSHLDRRETTAPLTGNTGRSILPEQVVFDSERAMLFVRGSGSDDIFAFQLEQADGSEGGNDFSPFINELAAGAGPRDMRIFQTGDGTPRLLVAAENSQQAVIINADSSETTMVDLDAPADQILLFEGSSPDDSSSAQRALLYKGGQATVSFLDLEGVEDKRGRNLETMNVGQGVAKLIPLLQRGEGDRQLALLIHDTSGVSLLDLSDRTVTPISSSQTLTEALFDPVRRRLWIGPAGQPWLGYLDVDDGVTGEIQLDADIEYLVPFFQEGQLAVTHRSAIGHVSVVQADAPRRETTESSLGFLIAGALQ